MAHIAFFQPLLDETMTLLSEARNYVIEKSEIDAKLLPIDQGLTASAESMRIVARLTQVMAWVLTQRAISNQEITEAEALSPQRRLGGQELCGVDTSAQDGHLPSDLRSLLNRSYRLYQRVARLDSQAERRIRRKETAVLSG